MIKVLAATLVAATALTGVAAFADDATKTSGKSQTPTAATETAPAPTAERGGLLSRVFGFDASARDRGRGEDTKQSIRDRFEQPDVHLR